MNDLRKRRHRRLSRFSTARCRAHCRGTTFAELVVAILIVGMLVVAALKTLGGATQAARYTAEKTIAQGLAEELLTEILCTHYAEPDDPSVFGIEGSESSTSRSLYDDVDDYNGWSASPPQDKDGTVRTDKANWRRQVAVRYVDDHDLTADSATDQGVKEISVKVYSGTKLVTTLTSIRANCDEDE